MRSLFRNLFQSPMRNATAEEDYIFAMRSVPGGLLSDEVTGVAAITSVAGTRYGLVNGVVTQFAVNQPAIEDNGLRGCPAFTQLTLSSEDISSISWSSTGLLLITTSTYQGRSISNIIEDTTNSSHQFSQSIVAPADNSIIGYCFICKPIAGKTKISIRVLKKDNTISVFVLDMDTAIFTTIPAGGIANVSKLSDGYLKIFLSLNALSGATNPIFNIRFLNESSLDSYSGNGLSGILFGQPSITNFGVAGVPFIPPYVPTTSATVSCVAETATASTGTSFDLDDPKLARLKSILRGPNAEGHVEITLTSAINSAWLPTVATTDYAICVARDAQFNFLNARKYADGRFQFNLTDSAFNGAYLISSMTPGQKIRIVADFGNINGAQKQRITVNGIKSAIAAFNGTYGTGDLKFFYGNTIHLGHIVKDSFKISDRPQW